ncbi:MAG: trypsin-like peptidase domain-containing protein, partial [Candidatus Eremiobacteraeota bacterium]|nr:trypsin-like peptidase domain-containing protein [Candidatus Eremiobacteraeota bacterium]
MKPSAAGYFLAALLGALLGGAMVRCGASPPARPIAVVSTGQDKFDQVEAAAEAVGRAVASIQVSSSDQVDPTDLSPEARPALGEGSGVVIRADGYLLTNNHVIRKAKKIRVSLPDREPLMATLVGADPFTDLAVVRVEAKDLPYLEFGDSEAVKAGEWLVAVGNPYGFGHSVTVGVLSSRGRRLEAPGKELTGLLQTDAAINPGNSGGPLANLQGQIVGINTAIIPFAQGIGFAVPSNTARKVAEQLIAKGKIERSYLGVRTQPVTLASVELLDLPSADGLIVTDLERDGPAHLAGI